MCTVHLVQDSKPKNYNQDLFHDLTYNSFSELTDERVSQNQTVFRARVNSSMLKQWLDQDLVKRPY